MIGDGLINLTYLEWISALRQRVSHEEGKPGFAQMEEWGTEDKVFAERVIGWFAKNYEKIWDVEGRLVEGEMETEI